MMKISTYESFMELRIDMSWFVHNCQTIHSKNNAIIEASNNLMKYVDEDIESIKDCSECYVKAFEFPDTSFTMTCERPHLLVWAKIGRFPYWPAKAMSVR